MVATSTAQFLLLLLGCAWLGSAKIYVDRPRGVPLNRKSLYDASKDFTCLDGSKTVPFEYVNDDYCDCADGSDEPGTSACVRGSFQCVNLGHSPVDIPSSRVNDQICDCCDGSDEYSGLVNCPDICEELGAQARIDAEERVRRMRDGFQKKQELIKDGQRVKAEKQKRLEELKKEKDVLDPQRDELDMKKQDIERQEREAKDQFRDQWKSTKDEQKRQEALAAFEDLDSNDDQIITTDEIQSRNEFDKDSDGQVSEDEAKQFLGGLDESESEHFIDEVWNNIKHVYKPPSVREGITPPPETHDPDGHTDVLPPEHTTPAPPPPTRRPRLADEDDEEEEEVNEDEVDDFDPDKYMKDGEKPSPPPEEENDDMPDYGTDETLKSLMDEADVVRRDYEDVDRKFQDVESEIKKINEFLETDLGPESEWASLQNKCYEITENQYLYRLCLFDRSSQREKSGGGETSLGSWDKWDGPEDDKYSVMMYARGQSCWNGPERSTEVRIVCGPDTKLTSASEPGRCTYMYEMTSPAVCADPSLMGAHEEL